MTTRLLLRIDEHWPREPAADWVLLDASNRVLQQGCSGAAHWPAADSCEAILAGAQCLWLEVMLPPAPKRERARLLAYALEEHLVDDPDTQHLTVTHSALEDHSRRTGVIVVGRARMVQLVAQFDAIGRPLSHLRSLLETVPPAPPRWTLAIDAHMALLRPGSSPTVCLEASSAQALADALSLSLAQAARRAGAETPRAIELRIADDGALPPLPLAQDQTPAFEPGPPWQWWAYVDHCTELLHGEFAPRHMRSKRWHALRAPLLLMAATVLALITANLVQILDQRQSLADLDARSLRLFARALPGTPAVAPEAQLARALADERRRTGRLAEGDFIALLRAHLEAAGATPLDIDYEKGKLDIGLSPGTDIAALKTRLALQGIDVRGRDGGLVLSARPRP
ncbi:hypothetical protein J5J83_06795 [Azoarcus sp. L1K30]|uniref:type II secretion system protein GspL n=1 Tax=Azoarcus sp. L1K30 TaxID=2820277 RepID=UPI001B8108F6|nr:type II secretion system protein GspL [Azoarcus sp. L1K30]MBR0565820.1 hypothetical protein [Azoarcus sp. L1K30]